MTELYINDNYIELDNSELLPTSQVADIFSVEDIYSGITKQFSAPKSAANKKALEGCDNIGAITYIPYRRNRARLLIDGVEVMFNAIAVVESSGDTFEIIIKYGNSDFFSLLTRKLNELDLSALEHQWTVANITASQTHDYTDGYTWQLIDFGLQKNQPRYNIRHSLPSVFVRYLIEKIAADNGYTLSGSVWTSSNFSSDTIPLISRSNSDSGRDRMQVLAWQNVYQELDIVAQSKELVFADILHDDCLSFEDNKYYVAKTDCEVNISALINCKFIQILGTETATVTIDLIRYSVNGSQEIIETQTMIVSQASPTASVSFNTNIVLSDYDKVGFKAMQTGLFYSRVRIGEPDYCTFWAQIITAQNTAYGLFFPIAENLPEITELDLFKAVAMKYGLIFQADNSNRILHAERFEDIAKRMNTDDSYDWTNKLDLQAESGDYERIRVNYRAEMSQRNWFRFAEDDSVPFGFSDAYFTIDDTTLPKSGNYVEFPFAASKLVVRAGFQMPEILLYSDYDGGTNSITKRWLQNYKQSSATLLLKGKSDMLVKLTSAGTVLAITLQGATATLLTEWDTNKETTIDNWLSEHQSTVDNLGIVCYKVGTDTIRFVTKSFGSNFNGVSPAGGDVTLSVTDSSENYTYTGDVSLATFVNATTILNSFYSANRRMLNYYKRLTCNIMLSVYDFVNFDHFKPVFIQELGWFYVEKINGFRTDASTEVEMVALDSFINAGRSEFIFEREIDSLEVVFTSESTNALSYKWDFGDGTQSTSQNPTKTYTSCGVYNVTLTVTDTAGNVNKITNVVNVPKPALRFNFKCNSQYLTII